MFLALALMAGAPHSGAHSASDYDAVIQQGNAQLQAGSADQALDSGEAAIKIGADRWEGYALTGSALMNLKRYEDAADALSKAIERAPQAKQPALRDLRRRSLLAESGYPVTANAGPPVTPTSAIPTRDIPAPAIPVTASTSQTDERQRLVAKLTWIDPATGLMWARYNRPAEYAHANFTRATDYCGSLRSLGYADWRLPTVAEFMRVYHFAPDSATVRLDGALASNEEILRYLGFWTSTPGGKGGEHVLVFEGKAVSSRNDDGAGQVGGWLAGHAWNGAIVCVRDQNGAERR
jgi:tetratricopeptide (TPR) repeat protein